MGTRSIVVFSLFGFAMTVTILMTFLMLVYKNQNYEKVTALDSIRSEEEGLRQDGGESQPAMCDCMRTDKSDEPENTVDHLLSNSITVNKRFSLIIPIHHQNVEVLTKVLNNYCSLSGYIDVIMLWSSQGKKILDDLKSFKCGIPLILNALSGRDWFKTFSQIKTEAVLLTEDDLQISKRDLVFQFETWKQFKHLVVGFIPESHTQDIQDPNLIPTSTAMFHIDYLRLYQRELENELRPTDNQIVNCCNAFVVAVVANYLKSPTDPTPCPGLLIEPKYIRRIGKNENSVFSHGNDDKVEEECLNLIEKHFNGRPFGYSTLRIVSA